MTSPDPFMIRAHTPDWEANVSDYRAASAATRRAFPTCRTVAYGHRPDEALDLFVPAIGPAGSRTRPIHLFVHGGYWRAFSKEDYAFLADAIMAAGAVAAIMDYSLMPAARMEVLVGQVRQAAHWLQAEAASFGGDPRLLSASGHSAGAHLASFLACRAAHEADIVLPGVTAVLLVSGLYDLKPVTRSFLQPELQLTTEEVERWSPIHATPSRGTAFGVLVGEAETTPFHAQAAAFAAHLGLAGAPGRLETVQGQDHMTIVRELGRPESDCGRHLAETIATRQA